MLTFQKLRAMNYSRVERWHGILSWSPAEWAVAMAGEAGEACNAIKKLKRIQDDIPNISSDATRQLSTEQEAIKAIGEELADTVIYIDLLASRLGLILEDCITEKFNKTSEQYDFPERI